MNNPQSCIENALVPHSAYERAMKKLEMAYQYAGTAEPTCVAVIGESRTGKSRLLEEFSEKYRPVRNGEGLDTPVLSARVPSKPTVKGLVELLLRGLGDPRAEKGTVITQTARLEKLLAQSKTKIVMLDEFQHFQDKGNYAIAHEVADWLKILVDKTKVSLVVAGLPTCQAVINQNEQLAGRFYAAVRMPRFDWSDEVERNEFIGILECFYDAMQAHFDVLPFYEESTAFRIYCGTGGLIGYVAKLLTLAVRNVCGKHVNVITYEEMERAYLGSVWDVENSIGSHNPFDLKVTPYVTASALQNAQQVGVPAPAPPRRRRGSRQSPAESLGQILSTR